MKVVVAMSGGVDSSVAAALMVQAGHEVIGIMLRLWAEASCRDNACCAPEAVEQARAVAESLGIPFYVLDYQETFKELVVEPFTQTYLQAATPNPCLICNRKVRFGALMDEARSLGAQKLVSGHYVRLEEQAGTYRLLKGLDATKDQSYVLYQLDQEQLAHCLFPLGGMDKVEVRRLAQEMGLEVASKPDSQDLCFVGDDGYRGFLGRHAEKAILPGEFVDLEGNQLGRHMGLPYYTVGQRRGLGISAAEPLYVVALDAQKNQVVLGPQGARQASQVVLGDLRFQQPLDEHLQRELTARIRYNMKEAPVQVEVVAGGKLVLHFDPPVLDVTPGQGAVIYDGDLLVGGGTILR
ncbi:MAG: tRNA 2-thiouridine(34) synthase MnmA [bacterium]|nr:tRNA 2-thiouridine(34) synthase MnmA [bacterium]